MMETLPDVFPSLMPLEHHHLWGTCDRCGRKILAIPSGVRGHYLCPEGSWSWSRGPDTLATGICGECYREVIRG